MRLPILTYHSIDRGGSVISTHPDAFREQVEFFSRSGYRCLTLTEAGALLRCGAAVPGPVLVITFDDGFRSVYREALPILRAYGYRATVFLVTDRIGTWSSWIRESEGIPAMPLMDLSEIAELAGAGWELGGHSATHPDLRSLDEHLLNGELERCLAAVRAASGQAAAWFAYPYGASDRRVRDAVARYFAGACGTVLSVASNRSDVYALERIEMYYLRSAAVYRSLGSLQFRAYITLRRWLHSVRPYRPPGGQ